MILLVIFMTFVMMRQIKGNPFRTSERAVPESIQREPRARSSTSTSPGTSSTSNYVKGVFTFDLGPSLVLRGTATSTTSSATHFPTSLELGVLAFLFAIVVGIPLGMIAALRHNTVRRLRGDVLLERRLRRSRASSSRRCSSTSSRSRWDVCVPDERLDDLAEQDPARRSRSASRRWRYFARLVRGTMLETLQQDYVRTARAKGLRYRRVVGLHVLRNSLIPVVTAAGPLLGFLITGSFVIEQIFKIPGIGQYYVTAVSARDYSVVMGLTVLLSLHRHLREPGRRHPLRLPRPAHAGRADLMTIDPDRRSATTSVVAEHAHRRSRGRRADPPVEPLAGRLAPLHPQPRRRRRRRRLHPASSSTASSGRSSRPTTRTRSTSRRRS